MDVKETRKLSGKINTVFETRYVKGVPFVNRRYKEWVPFLSKMVYERLRSWTLVRYLPV